MKILAHIFFVLLIFGSMSSSVFASSRDSLWSKSGFVNFNFGQLFLKNWANGGESSISSLLIFKYNINYLNGNKSWENSMETNFGMQNSKQHPFRKTQDYFAISTKYGFKKTNTWKYTYYASLRSQYAKGYNFPNDSTPISKFMSPAYLHAGVGIDFFIAEPLSIFISPLMLKNVIVNDDSLANLGAFGVKAAVRNPNGSIRYPGKHFSHETGLYAKAQFKKTFDSTLTISSNLELFTAYALSDLNVDFTWTGLLVVNFNKYFAATLSFEMRYDEDAIYFEDINKDGIKDELGPRTQFKEIIGLGILYKL